MGALHIELEATKVARAQGEAEIATLQVELATELEQKVHILQQNLAAEEKLHAQERAREARSPSSSTVAEATAQLESKIMDFFDEQMA
jgi:aspartyl/asparaginyl-tRNA synthetase